MKPIIILPLIGIALLAGCSSPAIVMPTPMPTPAPTPIVEPFEPMVINITVADIVCHDTPCANATGATMVLCDNKLAVNPTKERLEAFLNEDLTDEIPYSEPEWTCSDYVRTAHNNAEMAGIKCYTLGIFPKGNEHRPHILLAVDTVDNGTIYVDCGFDAWVNVKVGSVMVYTDIRSTVHIAFGEEQPYEVASTMVIK